MSTLRQRTFSGLGWNAATQLSAQGLQFATSVFIARLLGPHDFGLMGMVVVFTGFASIFYEMGLGAAVIQRQDLSERHLNSVFWFNVSVGMFLTAAFAGAAPIVARFYREPMLRSLTAVVSLTFIPASLAVVQNALIDKSINFRMRFWIGIDCDLLTSGFIAISMALPRGGGRFWSLVAQSLALAVTRLIVTWHLSAWRPAWSFDPQAFKELFRFSRNLLANSILGYWGRTSTG